jgi:hypothetical protein
MNYFKYKLHLNISTNIIIFQLLMIKVKYFVCLMAVSNDVNKHRQPNKATVEAIIW